LRERSAGRENASADLRAPNDDLPGSEFEHESFDTIRLPDEQKQRYDGTLAIV